MQIVTRDLTDSAILECNLLLFLCILQGIGHWALKLLTAQQSLCYTLAMPDGYWHCLMV